MGFYDAVGARLGKKREAKLRKLSAPHLEPGEEFLGWFIGLPVGQSASKGRASALAAGAGAAALAGGGSVFGAWKPFPIPGRTQPCRYEDVEWWEGALAVALTNLELHSFVVNRMTGKIKDYERRWCRPDDVLAASLTGLVVRTGPTTLPVGAMVGSRALAPSQEQDNLEKDLQGRYFEIPKDSEAAFDAFCKALAELKQPGAATPGS